MQQESVSPGAPAPGHFVIWLPHRWCAPAPRKVERKDSRIMLNSRTQLKSNYLKSNRFKICTCTCTTNTTSQATAMSQSQSATIRVHRHGDGAALVCHYGSLPWTQKFLVSLRFHKFSSNQIILNQTNLECVPAPPAPHPRPKRRVSHGAPTQAHLVTCQSSRRCALALRTRGRKDSIKTNIHSPR